VQRWSG